MSTTAPEILLIEDNPIDCVIIRSIIGNRYSLSIVGTASEAIKMLASVQFDAILLDLELPDSRGNTVKMIRCATSTPIIVVNGHDQHHDSLSDGAFASLRKPIDNNELLDSIASALAYEKLRPCREMSEKAFTSIDSKMMLVSSMVPTQRSSRLRPAAVVASLPATLVMLAAVFIAGGEFRGNAVSQHVRVESKTIRKEEPIDVKLDELRDRPSLPAVVWFRVRHIPADRMEEAVSAMLVAAKSNDRDTANAAECALTSWGAKCRIK